MSVKFNHDGTKIAAALDSNNANAIIFIFDNTGTILKRYFFTAKHKFFSDGMYFDPSSNDLNVAFS
jgi:hypothetical protein